MVVCGYALIGHDPAQAMRNVIELKNMINTGLKPVSAFKDAQNHSDATVNENKLDYDPNAAQRRDIFSSKSPMLLNVSNSLMSKTLYSSPSVLSRSLKARISFVASLSSKSESSPITLSLIQSTSSPVSSISTQSSIVSLLSKYATPPDKARSIKSETSPV